MHGWPLLCKALCGHKTIADMVERLWDSLHAQGTVCGPFQCENHSLADIVVFVCLVSKQRKAEGRGTGGRLLAFQDRCTLVVVSVCLGGLFSELVRARYCNEGNDAVMRPPPAIRTTTCKRNYVTVDAEAAWDLLERAMKAGTSLEAALALKDDEAAYGCSESQGAKWVNFALQLYYNRCDHLWSHDDVNHYNFVSDPGHHSYKECLVTLAFSWEQDTGAFPPWQHLLPGSELTPDDAAMDDNLATIAARNKLERVASYRQLQGTSHQLHLLSGRTLDDFDLPAAANVRPTDENESRIVVPDAASGRDISYIVDRTSGARLAVLPHDCAKVPLLTLMLDQGSIGTAGAAFSIFHQGKMVHVRFDKIHRIIRDLKNAEKHCMDSVFMVCKMWSAYLYGMNMTVIMIIMMIIIIIMIMAGLPLRFTLRPTRSYTSVSIGSHGRRRHER